MTDTTDDGPARNAGPLEALPLGLAVTSAVLLVGGVLFALATAAADTTGSADRFRLLGQAANPFIAFLTVAAAALVVDARRRTPAVRLVAGGLALGSATAVALAVVLLALNGLLTDVTGDTTMLFRLSAIVSRMATLVLGGVTLWLSLASGPARP